MPDVADKSTLEPHHIRSLALAGAVIGVVLLPIAAAQANPTGSGSGSGTSASAAQSAAPVTASPTAAQPLGDEFCGTTTSTGTGTAAVLAQSCVEQSDGTVAAKVYVSNGSAVDRTVTLNLTRTDGTLVQVQCVIAAGNTSASCETAALPTSAGTGAFNAIAELTMADQPVSDGVLHAESGLVSPTSGAVTGTGTETGTETGASQ